MDRKDGLPHPVTTGEAYQAAILDELRGLRLDLQKMNPEASDESEKLGTRIREPEPARKKK